ncbi:hypothetical protein HMSSN036_00380 [Paenibacillus macerans]|nr:hypothetical protein HMSSN036_00380 [Paenibacillus macerans]
MAEAMNELSHIAAEHSAEVDEGLWVEELTALSDRDDAHPRLSGLACAICWSGESLRPSMRCRSFAPALAGDSRRPGRRLVRRSGDAQPVCASVADEPMGAA